MMKSRAKCIIVAVVVLVAWAWMIGPRADLIAVPVVVLLASTWQCAQVGLWACIGIRWRRSKFSRGERAGLFVFYSLIGLPLVFLALRRARLEGIGHWPDITAGFVYLVSGMVLGVEFLVVLVLLLVESARTAGTRKSGVSQDRK